MFVTRLLSGIVLVLIELVTLYFSNIPLAAFLLFISMVGYLELTKTMQVRKEGEKLNLLEGIGLTGVLAYYVVMYFTGFNSYLLLVGVATFLVIMSAYVFGFPKFHASQVAAAVFSFVYAPVFLSFIYATRELEFGIYIVWLILICSWGCDTCAYCVGVLFGKNKMAPVLSPKKSVEGAIGGVAGAAGIGALFGWFVNSKVDLDVNSIIVFAIISAVGALISMVGDLAASAIKRNFDVKDYGKLIPGHGGVMDRFDSVIFAAPIIYFLAKMFI